MNILLVCEYDDRDDHFKNGKKCWGSCLKNTEKIEPYLETK